MGREGTAVSAQVMLRKTVASRFGLNQAAALESMSLTSAQQAAVVARGNVLVVAGAGTGKTSALVERCLNCLLAEQPRTALAEILMVTFTEAAAADMRRRIRRRLEQEVEENLKLQASSFREASNPNHQAQTNLEILNHLREQIA